MKIVKTSIEIGFERRSTQLLNKSVKQEMNLSDSQQQGCSTTYSTPF